MIGLRKSAWIGAALVMLPLPAAAQEMCATLNRIAASAREPVPFASLAGGAPVSVSDYSSCHVETGATGSVFCHRQLAPASLVSDIVGAQVSDCLGATLVPERIPSGTREYRTADLSIIVQSHCTERCVAGRSAMLRITRQAPDSR